MDLENYVSPGQLIAELIATRDWKQSTLAELAGISDSALNKIINGRQSINARMAIQLSEVFNIPPETFLTLQHKYDLAREKILYKPVKSRSLRSAIWGELPVSAIIKRGWLPGVDTSSSIEETEAGLARFFSVTSPEEIAVLPHAAKKSDEFEGMTGIQIAWLYRVKQIAGAMLAPKYSNELGAKCVSQLAGLRISREAIRKVPRILAESGIRFVIVESLPSAKIDGVCFWLDDHSPVIGMSLRFDRIDNFWFVLRHELEHVLRGHGKLRPMMDSDLEATSSSHDAQIADEERVANAAAAEFCTPQRFLQDFIARKDPILRSKIYWGLLP